VINAIERGNLDRLPLDGWIRPETWLLLRNHFGVEDNEAVMRILGIDIRSVIMDPPRGFQPTYVFPPQKLSKDFENWYATIFDEWGILRKAGATGEYWHYTYHPLEHEELDSYDFPDLDAEGRFDRAAALVRSYAEEYAVAGYHVFGMFEQAWALRGYRTFILDLYVNPSYANALLDRVLEWKIEQTRRLAELRVDIVEIGDDLATQTGLMLPPRLIKQYFVPRYKRWVRELKKSGVYVLFHSDGKMEEIIPDLIDVGIDILNPIQPECMDTARIKELYGQKLTFHGGISLQKTLSFGTPEHVKNEVLERIGTMGHSGGYIVAPTHMVDKHVPLENILALYETGRNIAHID